MIINFNDILMALSYSLDLSQLNKGIKINHSKRTCYIALKICDLLNLSNKEKSDISTISLLHHMPGRDKNWINYMTEGTYSRDANHPLEYYPLNLIYDIIRFTCHIDNIFDLTNGTPKLRHLIMNSCGRFSNVRFNPSILEAFSELASSYDFWLALNHTNIDSSLRKNLIPDYNHMLLTEIRGFSLMLCDVIYCKSDYTKIHSIDLTKKAEFMANFFPINNSDKLKLIIAATLHDIGKLAVPLSILNKPGSLTVSEYEIIKTHPHYTRMTLRQIKGFEEITEWASNHHEKLNGTGYPLALSSKEMDFNSRLIACLDIYQALTESRPYKKQLSHNSALKIMKNMCISGEIDVEIVEHIDRAFA